MTTFNFQTFTWLAKQSLEKAEEYRIKCWGKKVIVEEKLNDNIDNDEITKLKAEYFEKTWKKANVNIWLETLKEKLEAL